MSPEMDAAVARAAIADGDLAHAAHHVAAALASDPVRADLTALVDVLTAASGGRAAALALYPLEGGTWF
ncbi:MAG: hypothetical protein ABMB14_26190, partial [Myxococcota bacterium]